jgi:hypothetical protein
MKLTDDCATRPRRRRVTLSSTKSRKGEIARRITDDRGTQRGGGGADEITISDEAIERAMRVYTVEEAMDLLSCGAPDRSASTDKWLQFLVRMRAAPPTQATQTGLKEAEREIARRLLNLGDVCSLH